MGQPPSRPQPPAQQGDDRRAIYEQDLEFVRYIDGQKWSKFQTASAIEGAALYVSFGAGLSRTESVLLMVLATLFLLLVFALIIRDEWGLVNYHVRSRKFEEAADVPDIHMIGYPSPPLLRVKLTRVVMAAIVLFNIAVSARLAFWPQGLQTT